MKLTVLGLGLIGGSIALDLKASGFVSDVTGVDASPENCSQALKLGLVDRTLPLEEALKTAELVVLAIPVTALSHVLPSILSSVSDGTTVTDVGSTKHQIVQAIQGHPRRKNFVPSHPMAGTEFSGPSAALRGLFRNKASVICDQHESDPAHVQRVHAMYEDLGMRVIYMDSREHDLHAAYVSHLSHISSFILANTVLDKEKDVSAIFNLASAGFESTVRLAKSSPEMWAPIFDQNNAFIVEALGAYIDRLRIFHESLVQKDYENTKTLMRRSNEIRRVLEQIQGRTAGANK